MGSDDLQDQLSHYAKFVETVLKPKLSSAESEAGVVRAEIAEYRELKAKADERTKKGLAGEPLEALVDLGHGALFCNAVVRDPDRMFVKVGLGFHAEMTLAEASEFASKRISYLRANRLEKRESEIKEIQGHIQSASMILDQLHAEMRNS
ncbi:unnamed protein product [Pseudo-nitzschia multistriata]|uniref:Uncharacterized protein n=1 Tax=Pseudo-nitzschia multistriata TaxID=183589 RepID=A0A448ZTG9_9STRA|nr:unnamed protein product [Pseudo-nitzschia multistriata]